MTPIDQPFNDSALVSQRRAVFSAFPLLRCRLSATTTAGTKHNYSLMNTVDIYQLLLPGDNRKILLPGVNLNEVLNWSTPRNLQWWCRLLAGNKVCCRKTHTDLLEKVKQCLCSAISSTSMLLDILQGKDQCHYCSSILAAAMSPFSGVFFLIFYNTIRPVWKNSCKHHQQPSGVRKAPFGRFSLGR